MRGYTLIVKGKESLSFPMSIKPIIKNMNTKDTSTTELQARAFFGAIHRNGCFYKIDLPPQFNSC